MGVLVTGGTGFIGSVLVEHLLLNGVKGIVLLVRPETERSRYVRFQEAGVRVEPVVMHDQAATRRLFIDHDFETVYHIAAIRGSQPLPWEAYYAANVLSTECIAHEAIRQGSRLVYCSSVGVFGTIPQRLPADEGTPFRGDSAYHRSKVMAEERLRALVPQGLDVVILRPAITYGKGDYGFPYSLIKLVDSGLYVHCDRDLWVHMGDVQILADAFLRAAKAGVRSGSAYIIADRAPVSMRALIDSICYELRGRPYPRWKRLPGVVFDWACFTSGRVAKSERWKTRLQLISQSWYYDVGPAQRDLELELTSTIDRFRNVVEWYLGSTRGDRWRSPS